MDATICKADGKRQGSAAPSCKGHCLRMRYYASTVIDRAAWGRSAFSSNHTILQAFMQCIDHFHVITTICSGFVA